MSTTDTTSTLGERILALVSEERPEKNGRIVGPIATEGVEREPHDGSRPSRREDDMREWGLAYGLALGMLLGEHPDADEAEREQLADRALDAARAMFTRWCGGIAPRPNVASTVDGVLLAWDAADCEIDRLRYIEKQPIGMLAERLQDLRDAVGMPERAMVD
jgi:hypothetical protein